MQGAPDFLIGEKNMSYGVDPGSARVTEQGMLAPSDTAIRLYSVNMVLTGTATPAAACMVFADAKGAVTTTASPASVLLTVFYDGTIPVGFGYWECGEGLLFPNGCFIQTATTFNYASIVYKGCYSSK
jgi:hypothetical protein